MTIYFYSQAQEPYNQLSNLHFSPFSFDKTKITESMRNVNPRIDEFIGDSKFDIPSIEHLWHALKAKDQETFLRFIMGDLATDFSAVFGKDKAEQKRKYWMKKNNIGIVPKMASNKKLQTKLKLKGRMMYERELLDPARERSVWNDLHVLKYLNNSKARNTLLSTKGKRLVEFARGARLRSEHWGGLVDEKTNTVIGDNVMGQYMEQIRDSNKLS